MNIIDQYQFIDIHYHAYPDLYKRRFTAIEAGMHYQALCGAVVLKSHLGSTAIHASIASKMNLPVFPSVILNNINGGIHYRHILRALNEYQSDYPIKMIVDFPTITGCPHTSKLDRTLSHSNLSTQSLRPELILTNKQRLRAEVIDILKFACDYPIVLSTGHATQNELFQLIDACIQYHVPALLLNQPAHPITGLKAAMLAELAAHEFIWIEQTALTFLIGHQSEEDFTHVLRTIPRVIYSSDLGQTTQIDIMQWFKISQKWFKRMMLSQERQLALMKGHAALLLNRNK